MDKMADGLQKLGEDDLLQVVQMVHENKSPDSYTKNDIERMLLYSIHVLPLLTHNCVFRGRIPRRPVHAPRHSPQDAMGLLRGERRRLDQQMPRCDMRT